MVENAFLKLKQWRGIATRYTKRADSFLAAVQIRCIAIWAKNYWRQALLYLSEKTVTPSNGITVFLMINDGVIIFVRSPGRQMASNQSAFLPAEVSLQLGGEEAASLGRTKGARRTPQRCF